MPKNPKTLPVETARQFAFLQRLSMAHERAIRTIAGFDESFLGTEPIVGDWTIKDMLGHVVTWNDEFRRVIRDILQKDKQKSFSPVFQEIDFDEWNEERITEKRKWTWKRTRAELDRDYSEAVELIVRLKPNEFKKRGITPWAYYPPKEMEKILNKGGESVETLVTYHWRHMNQHSRMIEKWREKTGF